MNEENKVQIIAFYEFRDISLIGDLFAIRDEMRELFRESGVRGTLILASEGYNGMVCGLAEQISFFIGGAEAILRTTIKYKVSFHEKAPFRRIDVKVKPEIVTLKREVDVSLGEGTHVSPALWNEIISDPKTLILDTRNDYEYRTGSFRGAINPATAKFSDLPAFVDENLDPAEHPRIAMFCTGGIRCEKFAPYMKQLGFTEVYQLEGGILRYLEEIPKEETLWEGECFVFDERITVDHDLVKGSAVDHSQRTQQRKKSEFKLPA